MTNEKKDLTRIEDLGEYLHQLNEDNDLPEIPEESDNNFSLSETSEESSILEDQTPEFESSTFESSDFSADNDLFLSSENLDETPEFNTVESLDLPSEEDHFVTTETDFLESDHDDPLTDDSDDILNTFSETSIDSEEITDTATRENSFEIEESIEFQSKSSASFEPTIESKHSVYQAPENFSDIKKFAESTNFSGMSAEGNPSFSVLIKNVRYIEDVNDILHLLRELGLQIGSEEETRQRLMRGNYLVPRISEFAAIFLAHKLRRFDIDIQLGPSDEIHPPRHQETSETGIVSKHNLYQNQSHHFHFDNPKLDISQIIVSATPTLEGHQIIRYIGVATEHQMVDSKIIEDESSDQIPRYYNELAQKLKAHALKSHSNAVVGLNYQLTPLPSEYGLSNRKYRLTCTGNLVWANKI